MINLTIAKMEALFADRDKFVAGTALKVEYKQLPTKKYMASFVLTVQDKIVLEHAYEMPMTKRDANEQIVEDVTISLFSLGAWAMYSTQYPNDANALAEKAQAARDKIESGTVEFEEVVADNTNKEEVNVDTEVSD